MTLDELQARRKTNWQNLCTISNMLKGIKITFDEIQKQYEQAKKEYEQVDKELALIDGRAKKIEPATSGRGRKKLADGPISPNDLTQDEINELLAKLDPQSLIMEVPTPEEVAKANDLSVIEEEE